MIGRRRIMASTMRFVVCSSSCSNLETGSSTIFRSGLGSSSSARVVVFSCCCTDLQRNRKRRFLQSDTHPASVFILDNSAGPAHRLRRRQRGSGGLCNAVSDEGFGTGIWNSFSEFFRVVIQQEESPLLNEASPELHLQNSLNELQPLLQVCGKTVPDVHDIDSADEVLSQLLYAGFGRIGSTLDGLLSVIFPSIITDQVIDRKMVKELKPRCVSAEDFSGSLEAFYSWLKARLPQGGAQLALWGTAPGTKRVANLFRELLEGEISLEDSIPPKRTVNVASVLIKNEAGEMLVEAYQEMADGRIRARNRPLSEKMRPGESVEEACLRGICEELGDQMGARERVVLLQETYRRQEEERESFSYPGLLTSYVIHTISANVKQLPSTDFDTVEDEDCKAPVFLASMVMASSSSSSSSEGSLGNAVGVKKHFWKWVQASS